MKKKNRKLGKKYSNMKLKRIKHLFLIGELLGVFLSFSGHILDPRNKWVVKIVAPEYERANKVYKDMLNDAQEIKKTDPGFDLIIDVISKYVDGPIENISSLRARREAGINFFEDYTTGPSILLSIMDRNGYTYELEVRDLQPDIQKLFLENPLFVWGDVIFYFGLLITFGLILTYFFISRGTKS